MNWKKKLYIISVYYPFLFFGSAISLYSIAIIKLGRLPKPIEEASELNFEWLRIITLFFLFSSILIGIATLIISFIKLFSLNKKKPIKIIIINFITVFTIGIIYLLNFGYVLTWLLG